MVPLVGSGDKIGMRTGRPILQIQSTTLINKSYVPAFIGNIDFVHGNLFLYDSHIFAYFLGRPRTTFLKI